MLNAAEAAYWLDYPFTEEPNPRKEPTMTTPRYVAAEAVYTEPMTGERVPSWGVHDTVENTFAPFGGNEALAVFAAQKVAEKPYLDWSFVSDFTLAK